MFRPHYGACSECRKEDQLIVVKKGYCQKCNYELKKLKKTNNTDLLRSRGPSSDERQSEKSRIKSFRRLPPKAPTGEREIFERIANDLRDRWNCFVCGKPLGDLTASNFAHVLPKALNKYPLFKLNPNNIRLLCHDGYSSCHNRWDKEPRSTLTEPMWKKMFDLEAELKKEYSLLKPIT